MGKNVVMLFYGTRLSEIEQEIEDRSIKTGCSPIQVSITQSEDEHVLSFSVAVLAEEMDNA